ncbi:MAG TPA: T9SS type A sorting domain-containing protein [Ignavibacteria bacterium]|nr:T9SS type A sorting domain-containing protein [Ignavibacteria bacterium]HMQ99154.1 T9SS type A sorting domain-containing protein [Ignavibacteria bacterium]
MNKTLIILFSLIFTSVLIPSFIYSQSNPAAQQIPYNTDFSGLSHNSSTYPAGWQGWKVSSQSGTDFDLNPAANNSSLTSRGYASSTAKGIYNYNGKLGFLNAVDGDYSLVLSLKTAGNTNVVVEYEIMTLRNPYSGSTNTRINGVELQYRVGTSGEFKSLNSRVYINNTTTQTGTTTSGQNSKIFSVELPAECDNQNVVQVRWSSREITGTGSYPGFAIDNIDVAAYGKVTYYYYKGTGNLSSTGSWSSTPEGNGERPDNFTDGYQNFVISTGTVINFSEYWTVSGTNSKVIIGNGVTETVLKTINSAQLNAVTDIRKGSKLVISQSTSNLPVFGNLYPGSYLEVLFSSSLAGIPAESTYENLLLNSGGGHTYSFSINSPDLLIKKDLELVNTRLNNNGTGKFKLQIGGNLKFSSSASLTSGFADLAELVMRGSEMQVVEMNNKDLELNSLTILNPEGITLSEKGGSSNIKLSRGSANVLKMQGGSIEMQSSNIVLGSGTTEPGTLTYTSGFLTGSGSFSRWFSKSGLPTTLTFTFPMGAGANNRGISLAFSNSSITNGGMLTVKHTDLPGSESIPPFNDGIYTIDKKSKMSWLVTQSGSWSLGSRTISVKISSEGLDGINDVSGLTIVNNSVKAGGTFLSGTGSPSKPEVNRQGMNITDLGGSNGNGNSFSIGASAGNPLPVTLASFTCSVINRDVLLTWVTSLEINNKGFEIEYCRKEESTGSFSPWEKTAFVNGNGNSNTEIEYVYRAKKLTDGTYRFRIKQVDLNGNFEYFSPQNTTESVIGKPVKFEISQNYPNPSNPVSKIDYQLPFNAKVSLRVYDLTGKEVSVLADGNVNSGYHTAEFNGTDLSSGVYFYRILAFGVNGETYSKTMKLILVK